MRRSLLVFPALNGSVDFEKQEMDFASIWFRAPRPQWIALLIPQILKAAQAGKEITVSTWRQSFGYTSPDCYTLPSGDNYILKLYAPMGDPWPKDLWGTLHYFSSRREPAPGQQFIMTNDGLRNHLAKEFDDKFTESMRRLGGRPRMEWWARPNLKIMDLAPNAFPMPRMIAETIGLSPEEAAQRVSALRLAQPGSAYHLLRAKERAARKAEEEQAELEAETSPSLPEGHEPEPPQPTPKELAEQGRAKKERQRKATQGKVRADRFNEASAKSWSEKRIRELKL